MERDINTHSQKIVIRKGVKLSIIINSGYDYLPFGVGACRYIPIANYISYYNPLISVLRRRESEQKS